MQKIGLIERVVEEENLQKASATKLTERNIDSLAGQIYFSYA